MTIETIDDLIIRAIRQALAALYGAGAALHEAGAALHESGAIADTGIADDLVELEIPRHDSQGDLSTPIAMSAAKRLKQPPRKIAEAIAAAVRLPDVIERIDVAGPGFINFTIKRDYLAGELRRLYIGGDDFLMRKTGAGQSVQIEFVSANPTGPLHLGHGRGAALGSAISNLLIAAGYDVNREFYVNDAGRQVKLLGESVFSKYLDALRVQGFSSSSSSSLSSSSSSSSSSDASAVQPLHAHPFPEDGYHGAYVDDLAGEIFQAEGFRFAAESFADVGGFFIDYACRRMLELIKSDLDAFGVTFDTWQSERALYEQGVVAETIQSLRARGLIYDGEGAVWFKASAFGDEKDRVVLKGNGDYTYFASDISYHHLKIKRGFSEIIDIWGADHHGYIPRIQAALRAEGFKSEKLRVILVQMVKLLRGGKPVQMSKRSGEFITLKEIIEEIGADTARFIFLTRRPDSQLEFDLEVAKKESSENPVFYVQYAYARIGGILAKYAEDPNTGLNNRSEDPDLSLLTEDDELRIMKKLVFYPIVFSSAVRTREPHRITFYLQELAAIFHPYYNTHRVLTQDRQLTEARLYLCACIKKVIESGLKVLGVSTPDKM
jgi:arginyl-tRNA synthetase